MFEVAFIGRSNVGKSSLINMLCNKRELAKVSGTPGKTQMINHFLINDNMYWVDLPGYGFAKVSASQRGNWKKMIWEYLEQRKNLSAVFALIDSRLEPQQIDIDFINSLGEKQIPFYIIFTKADKSRQTDVAKNVNAVGKALSEFWEELPQYFITSAEKRTGRDKVLAHIEQLRLSFKAKE
ncbi:MAG: hypothetical protein RL660_2998 [Bacteroidota bacterium]|jgi:GTP-binding protein